MDQGDERGKPAARPRAVGTIGTPKAGSTMMNVNGRWSSAVAGICALLVLSAGCDRRSESSKAVEQSARDLHALSGGSPEPATNDAQKSTFTKVSADLSPAVSGSSAGDKAAASLLVCQTQIG